MNEPTDKTNDAFEYWWNSHTHDADTACSVAWSAWKARGRYDADHPAPPSAPLMDQDDDPLTPQSKAHYQSVADFDAWLAGLSDARKKGVPTSILWEAWRVSRECLQPPAPPSAWISVRDRLPEVGVSVLGYFKQDMCLCYRNSDGDWSNGKAVISISHWQPLPAPPAPADPFDAWWESLPEKPGFHECRRVDGNIYYCREAARGVWDSIQKWSSRNQPTP